MSAWLSSTAAVTSAGDITAAWYSSAATTVAWPRETAAESGVEPSCPAQTRNRHSPAGSSYQYLDRTRTANLKLEMKTSHTLELYITHCKTTSHAPQPTHTHRPRMVHRCPRRQQCCYHRVVAFFTCSEQRCSTFILQVSTSTQPHHLLPTCPLRWASDQTTQSQIPTQPQPTTYPLTQTPPTSQRKQTAQKRKCTTTHCKTTCQAQLSNTHRPRLVHRCP